MRDRHRVPILRREDSLHFRHFTQRLAVDLAATSPTSFRFPCRDLPHRLHSARYLSGEVNSETLEVGAHAVLSEPAICVHLNHDQVPFLVSLKNDGAFVGYDHIPTDGPHAGEQTCGALAERDGFIPFGHFCSCEGDPRVGMCIDPMRTLFRLGYPSPHFSGCYSNAHGDSSGRPIIHHVSLAAETSYGEGNLYCSIVCHVSHDPDCVGRVRINCGESWVLLHVTLNYVSRTSPEFNCRKTTDHLQIVLGLPCG